DAVDPRRLALTSEQHEQSPVAEAPAAVGELSQAIAQRHIRLPLRLVADHLAISTGYGAGPPFRQAACGPQMRQGAALGGRPYHLFDRSSRSAEASSIWSASSFFSLAFSSSSAFRRLASETSMPPYLAFQLYSVASEIPCLRARSSAFAPASCSRRTAMICSSVNLLLFICPSFKRGPDSNREWWKFPVAGQSPVFVAAIVSSRLGGHRTVTSMFVLPVRILKMSPRKCWRPA